MNARLQVEHPVSEFVAGHDLVRLQIAAAQGEVIDLQPTLRGHAIECRINAEDPAREFLPGPGLVTEWIPPGGPFVRLDSGVVQGRRVVGDYDSLIAKLIVWGEDREHARHRMLRALGEFGVHGIPTTIPFHRWLLDTPEFAEGRVHTKWIEEAIGEGRFSVGEAAPPATAGAAPRPVSLTVEVDGHRVPVAVWGDQMHLPPAAPATSGHAGGGADGSMVVAPMQGTILQVLVEVGQEVTAGQTICVLEAMKMENHVAAVQDGRIAELLVAKGAVVDAGQALAVLE
jgi:acetyl-CoA/propionyl-CoA carboxylase biotin carboxyl carrier protein